MCVCVCLVRYAGRYRLTHSFIHSFIHSLPASFFFAQNCLPAQLRADIPRPRPRPRLATRNKTRDATVETPYLLVYVRNERMPMVALCMVARTRLHANGAGHDDSDSDTELCPASFFGMFGRRVESGFSHPGVSSRSATRSAVYPKHKHKHSRETSLIKSGVDADVTCSISVETNSGHSCFTVSDYQVYVQYCRMKRDARHNTTVHSTVIILERKRTATATAAATYYPTHLDVHHDCIHHYYCIISSR
jgi:hypothetical protein